jgi:hypothetical protein
MDLELLRALPQPPQVALYGNFVKYHVAAGRALLTAET